MAEQNSQEYHNGFDYSAPYSAENCEVFDWKSWVADHVTAKQIEIADVPANIDAYVTAAENTCEALKKDKCPPEIAQDLSLLVLYDLVLLIDDSTSMDYEEIPKGGKGGGGKGPRIATLKKVLQAVADVYTHANPKGIVSVKFLNTAKGKSGVTREKLKWFDEHSWGGVTRIGSELKRKILDQRVYKRDDKGDDNSMLKKPLLIITITDGAVEGERPELLPHTIIRCVRACEADRAKGKGAVSFQFAQVGNDPDATQFLRRLATDPKTKEFVDCLQGSTLDAINLETTNSETGKPETTTNPETKWEIIPQLLLGAISPRWKEHYVPVKIKGTPENIDPAAAKPDEEEDDSDEDAV